MIGPLDRLPLPAGLAPRLAPHPASPYFTASYRATLREMTARLPARLVREAIDLYRAEDPAWFGAHGVSETARVHTALTLAAALASAEAGARVFDLHGTRDDGTSTGLRENPKLPRGQAWQVRATSDRLAIIAAWLGRGRYPAKMEGGERFPFASRGEPRNLGLATGLGMIALDVDGEVGRHSLAEWVAAYGPLPLTWAQHTGRVGGGWQALFSAPLDADVHNSAGSLRAFGATALADGEKSGLDVRAWNGYVVAGPSMHPSGACYRWDDGCAPWERPIAPCPEDLLDAILQASKISGEGVGTGSRAPRSSSTPREAAAPHDYGLPGGFEARLDVIGDGEGYCGYDRPIYGACCSWYMEHGPEADPAPLYSALEAAIRAAPKAPGRDGERYFRGGGIELRRQVERAQAWAATVWEPDEEDEVAEVETAAPEVAPEVPPRPTPALKPPKRKRPSRASLAPLRAALRAARDRPSPDLSPLSAALRGTSPKDYDQ